jgi:hypothetical protein
VEDDVAIIQDQIVEHDVSIIQDQIVEDDVSIIQEDLNIWKTKHYRKNSQTLSRKIT